MILGCDPDKPRKIGERYTGYELDGVDYPDSGFTVLLPSHKGGMVGRAQARCATDRQGPDHGAVLRGGVGTLKGLSDLSRSP